MTSAAFAFIPVEKARVFSVLRARLTGVPADPTTVGRYTILDRVGMGAHGVVYRAHDPKLDREVALKLVLAPDPERVEVLLSEALALAKLAHPNVVSVFDAGVCEAAVFIAMEYVDGMTLGDWFASAPRSAAETIRVMLDAGRGLAAAHAADLVHRDFKPGNVMVGHDGRVRVLDFGLARPGPSVLEVAHATTPAGTPGYMAPELRRGDPPSAASDQFAYAVTFHEALTQRRPTSSSFAQWWLRFAKPIIARGLRPDPVQRHSSVARMIVRFERRRSLYMGAGLAGAAAVGAALTGALLH